MPLCDDELERYARQIIIPGIGEAGQQRLLDARVLVMGAAPGVEQAARYLRAAGVTVLDDTGDVATCCPPPSAVVVAGAETLTEERRRDLVAAAIPVCWYVLEDCGFTSGRHPQAPLPASQLPGRPRSVLDESLHDVAACDAAAVACALLAGIAGPAGPFRCELE